MPFTFLSRHCPFNFLHGFFVLFFSPFSTVQWIIPTFLAARVHSFCSLTQLTQSKMRFDLMDELHFNLWWLASAHVQQRFAPHRCFLMSLVRNPQNYLFWPLHHAIHSLLLDQQQNVFLYDAKRWQHFNKIIYKVHCCFLRRLKAFMCTLLCGKYHILPYL